MNKGMLKTMLALVVVALTIAGCGGGDETTTLTRSQFVKQANTICARQSERRENIVRKAIQGQDQTKLLPQAQREEVVIETVGPYAEVAKELESLGAPDGDEEKVEAIVRAIEEAASDIRSDPATALESTSQFSHANDLASAYGLNACAI